MRLLKIKGKNLASLVGEFELDFREGPLAEAGLFAITGEAGAGKSPLLAALCLALYGRYPRQALVAGDRIADVNGYEFNGDMGVHILRMVQGRCYAEVEFAGQDGKEYRARWELKRAREKAHGKLQAVQRSVVRLEDGQTLADKVEAVQAEVRQLVGLSYDEFRRAALLAQGQFDAFLQADENDRAALLEKITGTDLYQRISARVFEVTKEKKEAVSRKLESIGNVQLMGDEEKANLTAERVAATEKAGQEQQRRQKAQEGLTKRQNLAQQQAHAEEVAREAERTREQHQALASERALLAEVACVEPLRGKLTEWKKWQGDLLQGERLLVLRQENLKQAEAEAIAKEQQWAREATAQAQLEQERKNWEPVWQAAQKLDEELKLAAARKKAAGGEAAHAAEKARIAAQAWRDEEQGVVRRAEELSALEAWIDRESWRGDVAGNQAWMSSLVAERGKLNAKRKTLKDRSPEVAAARAELDRVGTRLAEMGSLWSAAQLAVQEKRLDDLSVQEKAGRAYLEARKTADVLTGKLAELSQQRAEAEAKKGEAEQQGLRLAGQLTELSRAALVAEESVAQLRARLKPGEACPVCGSREHPYHDQDEHLQQMAREFREREEMLAGEKRAADALVQRYVSVVSEAEGQAKAFAGQLEQVQASLASLSVAGEEDVERWRQEREMASQELLKQREALSQRGVLLEKQSRLVQDLASLQQAQEQWDVWQRDLANNEAALQPQVAACRAEWSVVEGRIGEWWRDVETQLREWQEKQKLLDEKKLAQREAFSRREQKHQAREEAAREAGVRETEAAAAGQDYERLASQRRELLGGEETEVHRSRFLAAVQQAEKLTGERKTDTEVAKEAVRQCASQVAEALTSVERLRSGMQVAGKAWEEACAAVEVLPARAAELLEHAAVEAVRQRVNAMDQALAAVEARRKQALEMLGQAQGQCAGLPEIEALLAMQQTAEVEEAAARTRIGAIDQMFQENRQKEERRALLGGELEALEKEHVLGAEVNEAIGSSGGDKFRRFVQALTMEQLVGLANYHLRSLAPRFQLERSKVGTLGLQVRDSELGDEVRAVAGLSGGERFLVSLGLALGLSGLEGKESFVDSLFIDEGFGTLARVSLELVLGGL